MFLVYTYITQSFEPQKNKEGTGTNSRHLQRWTWWPGNTLPSSNPTFGKEQRNRELLLDMRSQPFHLFLSFQNCLLSDRSYAEPGWPRHRTQRCFRYKPCLQGTYNQTEVIRQLTTDAEIGWRIAIGGEFKLGLYTQILGIVSNSHKTSWSHSISWK